MFKQKNKQRKALEISSKLIVTIIVWGIGILMIMPFIWMLSTSFKPMNEVFTFPIEWLPENPTLAGYKALFSEKVPFTTYIFNSIKVSAIALVGTFFSCTMSGFAYAKMQFTGRDKFFLLHLLATMVPGLITMLPLYMLFSKLSLLNSLKALWVPWVFGGTFGVFVMRQGYMSIPNSIIEAARVDGANPFQIYWRIALPNVKPAVSSVLFMYFLWTWNEYEKPMLFNYDAALQTLPTAVKYFSDGEYQNFPAIMAANVIMMLPIMILFICMQKTFIASLTSSSVKG